MMRYYFHLSRGADVLTDDGIECETIADALREADLAARELFAASIVSNRDPPSMISIYDDHARQVAEVTFKSLVPRSLR